MVTQIRCRRKEKIACPPAVVSPSELRIASNAIGILLDRRDRVNCKVLAVGGERQTPFAVKLASLLTPEL